MERLPFILSFLLWIIDSIWSNNLVFRLFCFNCADKFCSINFQGKVKYVVRPVLPSGCETKIGHCGVVGTKDPLNLGGYGVELALKNMEYKAMDDSKIKKG